MSHSVHRRGFISRQTRWGVAVPAAALTAALALAGCTGGGDSGTTEPRELVSTAPAASGPVDSIVWNLPTGEPATIDPPNAATFSGAGVVSNLCDSLLTHDEDYNLSANIADFEVTSPTTIVYTIRDDAKFWDGTPVTVDDVVYSLRRSADPLQIVSFIYANVASIDATSDNEVTVTFSQPDELFNVEMTTFAGMVVKKDFAEAAGADFGTSTGGVMCSGPFKFDSWTPGDSITVARNADYWNADRVPLADEVKFTFVTDSTAYTQAMIAGEIDGSYEIAPAAIPALESADSGNLYFGPSNQSMALTVATPDGPLADLTLREALAVLIDRQALADVVYEGAATPNYTTITPATWPNEARETYAEAYEGFEEARQTDLERATALIEESGYDGTEVVLAIQAGDQTTSQFAQLIQQEAKKAGLIITIDQLQPIEFAEAQYDPTKRVGIDLFIGSSFNGVQDPLEPTGFIYLPEAFYNLTGFDDPDVTRLLTEARQSFDAQERADMFVEAQAIYEEQLAVIPLLSTNTVTFLNDRLAGAVTSFAYLTMPALVSVGSSE